MHHIQLDTGQIAHVLPSLQVWDMAWPWHEWKLQHEGIIREGLPASLQQLAHVQINPVGTSCTFRARDRVAWVGSCGCVVVSNKEAKGVDNTEEKCRGMCGAKANQKCYCANVPCNTCVDVENKLESGQQLSEAQLMLYETKCVFRIRRAMKHDWWLFVEVPLERDGGKKLKVDCVLVLAGAINCTVCCGKHGPKEKHTCMLAIEHHGMSHTNAFPREGSKEKGQAYQDGQDVSKECVLKRLRIRLLQCWSSKVNSRVDNTVKRTWRQQLTQAMRECERELDWGRLR